VSDASGRCPACEKGRLEPFLEIPSVPVYCNRLWPTREEAVAAPRGSIRLGFCPRCGMIHNLVFDPSLVAYTPDYENSLHFSPQFQRYAEDLADRLIRDYRLTGKDIVEIGCGKGEFLELLCRDGRNRGIGFDASYEDRSGVTRGGTVRIEKAPFSEDNVDANADLICCRHVLEHIARPAAFLAEVRRAARRAGNPVLYFEVPDALWTLRDLGIWDIIYEHPSYFLRDTLIRLFERAGFAVARAGTAFAGQFLSIEASLADSGICEEVAAPLDESSELVARFASDYRDKTSAWQQRLDAWLAEGRRVAIWGAGSKGVTFLNVVPAAARIETIVDVNPRKTGRHVPGSGQVVREPAFLRQAPVDLVLVMNPIYRSEIRDQLEALDQRPELVSV